MFTVLLLLKKEGSVVVQNFLVSLEFVPFTVIVPFLYPLKVIYKKKRNNKLVILPKKKIKKQKSNTVTM